MNNLLKKTVLLLLLAVSAGRAQPTEGVVTYERTTHWTKILNRLPYLSQEEKDRILITSKKGEGAKERMTLWFRPQGSLFTYENDQGQSDNERWTWSKDTYVVSRDFDRQTGRDLIELLGKTYLIEDSLRTPVWKVLNQIKDVKGYICMKAETTDPVRGQKIAAWFAQDIPVPAGPERYFGLPGLIMELDINEGDVIIEAVDIRPMSVAGHLALPKNKGRRINESEYNRLLGNYIEESIKDHRNPYWSLRY